MKLTFDTAKIACLVCLCILFIGIGQTAVAQTESPPAEEEQNSDSEKTYPEKRKSREAWETILSFPGKLISFPFKLIFKGAGEIATFFAESHILTRINDFLNSDDGVRSALPEYSARTGGGMVYYHRGLLNQKSELAVRTSVGLRLRREFQASFQGIQLGKGLYVDLLARYRLLTDEPFFGLGNESNRSNKSNYAHEQAVGEISFGLKLSKKASAYTQIGYEINNIQEGRNKNLPSTTDPDLYSEETLPGLTEQLKFSRLGLALHYDGKNHPGRPSAGSELLISGSIFNELGDNRFGFWKASADISHYINLFYNRILVLRAMGEFTEPISDKKIPFYHLSEIGRRETIRGFHRGQFRAKDMILGSLEYRYPIWRLFDAVLFVDAGKVSDNIFDDFSTKDFHVGYGGGIRIWGEKGMIAKFEIAKSKDGIRIYFVLGKGIVG